MVRELGRRIVAGACPPGSLIEDEAMLAGRYRVSRSVVRDAAKILVGKGLLEVRRGIGTRVWADRGMLDDDVLAWHQSAPPSAGFLWQLMGVRQAIEPKAARWATEWASDEDICEIRDAQIGMEDEKESVEDFIISDARFHRSIIRAAHNDFLAAMEGIIFSAFLFRSG